MTKHVTVPRWGRLGMVLMALTLIASLTGFRSVESLFAPDSDLWPRWLAHDDANAATIDYADWGDFLRRNVQATPSGVNVVDYGAVTPDDHAVLDAFIARLEAVPISGYARRELPEQCQRRLADGEPESRLLLVADERQVGIEHVIGLHFTDAPAEVHDYEDLIASGIVLTGGSMLLEGMPEIAGVDSAAKQAQPEPV